MSQRRLCPNALFVILVWGRAVSTSMGRSSGRPGAMVRRRVARMLGVRRAGVLRVMGVRRMLGMGMLRVGPLLGMLGMRMLLWGRSVGVLLLWRVLLLWVLLLWVLLLWVLLLWVLLLRVLLLRRVLLRRVLLPQVLLRVGVLGPWVLLLLLLGRRLRVLRVRSVLLLGLLLVRVLGGSLRVLLRMRCVRVRSLLGAVWRVGVLLRLWLRVLRVRGLWLGVVGAVRVIVLVLVVVCYQLHSALRLLFKLVHQSVLFSLEGQHLLLGLLLIGGRQLQQRDVSILLTNGCQESLLFHFEDLFQLFPAFLSHVGQMSISLL